jgi:hypothetical protein
MNAQRGRPRLDKDSTPKGVSRESIRQMQKNALRKARRILARRGYKAEDFFDMWIRRTNNVR